MPIFRSYIICATPRSGSTLLCDLMESTGVAGRPASYFRKQSIPRWAERLNVPVAGNEEEPVFDRRYIEAVIAAGQGGTDLFGLRIMRDSVDALSARLDDLFPGLKDDRARLEAVFGPSLFIHLSRIDKVSQAVSRVKAMQTGLWHLAADGTERERTSPGREAAYDRNEIAKYVAELTAEDEGWNRWFESNRIQPLRLTYETLSRDAGGSLVEVMSALGLDPAIASNIEPKTAKLSDDKSKAWAARFLAETNTSPAASCHAIL